LKKWGFLLILIMVLGFVVVNIDPTFEDKVEVQERYPKERDCKRTDLSRESTFGKQ